MSFLRGAGTALGVLLCVAGCDSKKEATKDAAMPGDGGSPDAAVADGGTFSGPAPWSHGVALGAQCNGVAKAGVKGKVPSFKRETISEQPGVGYVKPVNLNNDAQPEFLLTCLTEGVDFSMGLPPLAAGGAYVLSRTDTGAGIGTWASTKVFDKDTRITIDGAKVPIVWPNASELVDVDADGVRDWVIGAGFLTRPVGMIPWMKGAADGTFGKPGIIEVPDATCWYHETPAIDIDGDGDEDFVTSCHIGDSKMPGGGSVVEWFENPGDGTANFKAHTVGEGGGTLVTLADLDEDGDQDIIAAQFFEGESLVWFEQTKAKGAAWTKHVISATRGRGFITRMADMDGDGKDDVVFGNHNNELANVEAARTMGIYWFGVPDKSTIHTIENWEASMHTVYEGFMVDGEDNGESGGAPGVLQVGDVDGDCDIDIAASGDGDLGLYLFVQQDTGFDKVDLDVNPLNANSGEQHFLDMDADGDLDIVWAVFGPIAGVDDPTLHSSVSVFVQQ